MKLSQAKIDQLVERLVDLFAEIDGVLFQGNDAQLMHGMREIIVDELMVEERLDAEVHQMLNQYKTEITMQRLSYDELFKRTRQKLIHERKIVL